MTSLPTRLLLWGFALVAVLGPVIFAHYGRSPADRLHPHLVLILLLVMLITFVIGIATTSTAFPLPGPLRVAALAIFIGPFGLIVYGVVERLILSRSATTGMG